MKQKRLEDIFAGTLELTASDRGILRRMLTDAYMRGVLSKELHNRLSQKIGDLKLHRMVTPDGSRLVSVEEHAKLVAAMFPQCLDCFGAGEREIYPGVETECFKCGGLGYIA